MYRVALSKRAILGLWVWPVASACVATAAARADAPDPVVSALTEAGMDDVLEAHLLAELDRAADGPGRDALIERLAALYAGLLRSESMPAGAERTALTTRAWALADRAGESRAFELRLTLLLNEYLPIERAADLHELRLLSDEDRARHVSVLRGLSTRLRAMAQAATTEAVRAERLTNASADPMPTDSARAALRARSLTNYYAAWSGLTLATLEERVAPDEIKTSFGWLLGAEGQMPMLESVPAGALELDHVARAAIGVGRARALGREWLLAEQWLRLVAESDRASDAVRSQATARLLRVSAQQRDWVGVLQLMELVRGGEALPTAEARYVALAALEATRGARTDSPAARVAEKAIDDLIARGEIGHVLDLRDRFGASGLLGDGFVGQYAAGLDRLELAQQSGTPGLFGDAAASLLSAAAASDAARFPVQRDDARLKAAFAEIRAGRPRDAIKIARSVIDADPGSEAREEAAWLLVVAIDETLDPALRPELAESVRSYLAAYPGTERASRLLVRHAGTDILDPAEAGEGLRAIGEDDPVALAARRVLLRLMYRAWVGGQRADTVARQDMLGLIDWIWARESGSTDRGTPADRLEAARIALDVTLGATPVDTGRAVRALGIARRSIGENPKLARYGEELQLRAAEVFASSGELDKAAAAADELRAAASPLGSSADRVLLAAVLRRLDDRPDDLAASTLGVRIGTRLSGELIPPEPERLGPDTSAVIDRVWRLMAAHAERSGDPAPAAVALRLGRVVLERGMPTAQGLRDLASLAGSQRDVRTELDAWSGLLSAARPEEEVWWEARYHTLRLLGAADPDAARRAMEQHRVLHPGAGVEPWATRIEELFPAMRLPGGASTSERRPGEDGP